MAKQIGVILSGCGVYDGSEIHESVFTLLALDKAGAKAVCMAPDIDQMHVINHLTGEQMAGEKRNVLVESARIARGDIKNVKDVRHQSWMDLFYRVVLERQRTYAILLHKGRIVRLTRMLRTSFKTCRMMANRSVLSVSHRQL